MGVFPSSLKRFDPLSILFLEFRGRRVAVFRTACLRFDNILPVAQLRFAALQGVAPKDVVLLAAIPGYPDAGEAELSMEIWPTISTVVPSITIALESEMRSSSKCSSPVLPDYQESRIESETASGGPPLALSSSHIPPSRQRPDSDHPGQPDYATQAVASPLDSRITAPRKPVIYLYPPSSLPNVTVELLLTPSWHFSAVYPPPRTAMPSCEHQTAQSLTWVVAAEPNGTLVDKTTGTEVSYLYWEAIAKTQPITPDSSRATTPVLGIASFDPSRPSVNPSNSILLPIRDVPGYLDAVLKALALHTEARTSFITYWLPDLLNHEYIALRFLPQASYEQAAQMRITPTPDIVTRVFMLFRGVPRGDLGVWEQAAEDRGPTFWARVVGVDLARASDPSSFCVLEWGGMEIK